MVRVISVHHFTNQDIQTVEQPTACTVALPNRLLLALTSNCVEVRNLSNESEVLFSFPTVDEVVQIVHSIHGNFHKIFLLLCFKWNIYRRLHRHNGDKIQSTEQGDEFR